MSLDSLLIDTFTRRVITRTQDVGGSWTETHTDTSFRGRLSPISAVERLGMDREAVYATHRIYCNNIIINEEDKIILFYDEILANGTLESWTGNTPDSWTKSEAGTSAITKETTTADRHGGLASAKYTIDAANDSAYIYQTKALEAQKRNTAIFWYKTVASKTVKAQIKTTIGGTVYYLGNNGIWTTTASFFASALTNTVWTECEFPFVSKDAGNYILYILNETAPSSIFHIDDLSLKKYRLFGIKGIRDPSNKGHHLEIDLLEVK